MLAVRHFSKDGQFWSQSDFVKLSPQFCQTPVKLGSLAVMPGFDVAERLEETRGQAVNVKLADGGDRSLVKLARLIFQRERLVSQEKLATAERERDWAMTALRLEGVERA